MSTWERTEDEPSVQVAPKAVWFVVVAQMVIEVVFSRIVTPTGVMPCPDSILYIVVRLAINPEYVVVPFWRSFAPRSTRACEDSDSGGAR